MIERGREAAVAFNRSKGHKESKIERYLHHENVVIFLVGFTTLTDDHSARGHRACRLASSDRKHVCAHSTSLNINT